MVQIKYLVMKALNIDSFYLKSLFLLSITLFVFSCRQIPEDERNEIENISLGQPVSVKINLKGVEWTGDINENPIVGENNSGRG